MTRYPVIPGAEAASFPGTGSHAREAVVVTHGFTGNPISVKPLAEALAARGYRVEVPRLPGHGTHWRDMLHTRYADWRGEVVRVLDGLLSEGCSVVLAGLSMGGTLSLDIACDRQSAVSGVIAINALVLDREGTVARMGSLIEPAVPAVPASAAGLRKNDVAKPDQDERAYRWVPTKAASSLLRQLPDLRRRLPSLDVPVLVVRSLQDHCVTPENSLALLGLLAMARAEDLPLERSFHIATMDHDLPLVSETAAEFVARVEKKRATDAA